MQLLDVTLPALADNLALDEALLLDAQAGGPEVLRFWQWLQPAIVIGAGGRWALEANVAACQRDGVPIMRRSSGGGTVLLGPGCLLFSLVLAYDHHPALADLHASYRYILGTLQQALAPLASGLVPAGISDLAMLGKKCSGNAQQRKRTHLLHHGTILCSMDLTQLPRYLAHPPREPDYRRQRAHLDFVTNLGVSIDAVMQQLRSTWQADEPLPTWPRETVRRLVEAKYARHEWHRRR